MSRLRETITDIADATRGRAGTSELIPTMGIAEKIRGLAGPGELISNGERYEIEDIRTEKLYGDPEFCKVSSIQALEGVIDAEGNLYTFYNGTVKLLNQIEETVWSVDLGSASGTIMIYNNMIMIQSGQALYFYSFNGEVARMPVSFSLHCKDKVGTIYIVNAGKTMLTKINPDGSIHWNYTLPYNYGSVPCSYGSIACSSESVLVYSTTDERGEWIDAGGSLIGRATYKTMFIRPGSYGNDWVVVSEDGYIYSSTAVGANNGYLYKYRKSSSKGDPELIFSVNIGRFPMLTGGLENEQILLTDKNSVNKFNTDTGAIEKITTVEYPTTFEKGEWLYVLYDTRRILIRINMKLYNLEILDMPKYNESNLRMYVDDVGAVWISEDRYSSSSSQNTYLSVVQNNKTNIVYQDKTMSASMTGAASHNEKTYLFLEGYTFRAKHKVTQEWKNATLKNSGGGL